MVAAVFFFATLNAHACLVPFFPENVEATGNCPMTAEPTDAKFCETFTAVGVDGIAKAHPHPVSALSS